jgi:hypothetical protein
MKNPYTRGNQNQGVRGRQDLRGGGIGVRDKALWKWNLLMRTQQGSGWRVDV